MAAPDRARSHGRIASGDERRRVAIPRRSTRGPLDVDIDDPLSPPPADDPLSQSVSQAHSPATSTSNTQRLLSPTRGLPEHHDVTIPDLPPKDFSFLQDPSAYHVLPTTNIPPPFAQASQPPLSTPIDSLLKTGHYRLAAIAAARQIVQSPSASDYTTLLRLLHIRLACLTLINEHSIAAHESKVLGDLSSAFYRHEITDQHVVPWDLRILCVRLLALGYGEWRRGIMGFYELASECREAILKAESEEDRVLWKARLRDCGVRVANVLVEMGDLEGAGRHLATLSALDSVATTLEARETLRMETLVWLRVGNLAAARNCLAAASEIVEDSDDLVDGTLNALLQLASGDYAAAISEFEKLHERFPEDAMVSQNLAVCLLYTGQIAQARTLLTELSDSCPPFHSLVFNLSTVYELCTERNRDKKVALAERMAAKQDGGLVGWELSNADFKL